MSFGFAPDHISADFERNCAGYLSAAARRIPEMIARLPVPVTPREMAIARAMGWIAAHPAEWDRRRNRRVN